ncbi:hypothetical protein C9374_009481 [Naegleria lovaniensis]|uniref:Uncharacterized protein n=1 Tax=Naegleria lovaniensis TaxID=51637 RepID=A0AA88KRQ9_NAELO|nr:uncharacterized protein C9374_009481 [Naegleria lovaniensis]KAG2392904.1 hypothetical protein C9374_009481 [Naegleria lovaniensis]
MQHSGSSVTNPSESGLLVHGDEELRPLTATPFSSSLEDPLSSGQLNSGEQPQDENPPRLMLVICLLQGLIYPMIFNIFILSWDYFMYLNNEAEITSRALLLSALGIGHAVFLSVYWVICLFRSGKQADNRWMMAILTGFPLVVSCILWLVAILFRTNDFYSIAPLFFLALGLCMSCWNSQIWLAVRVLPMKCMRAVVYGIECSGFMFGVLRLATKYGSLLISVNEQASNNEFIFLMVFLTMCYVIAFAMTIPFLWMLVKSEYYVTKWNHYQQELEMALEKQRGTNLQTHSTSVAASNDEQQTQSTSGATSNQTDSQNVFLLSFPSNVITSLVFPVLLVFLKSNLLVFKNNIFPIVLVTVFAFTAMMGSFTSFNCAFPRRWMSVLLGLSRLPLVPLFFLLCGEVVQFFNDHIEVIALIITMLFSFSHGYSSTSLYLRTFKEYSQIEDYKRKSVMFSFNIFLVEAFKLSLVIISVFLLTITLSLVK